MTCRVQLHPAQYAFHHTEALFRGFVGGRGAGKSFVGAYDLCRRMLPNRMYAVIAPTYPMLRDATMRSFMEVSKHLSCLQGFLTNEHRAVMGNNAEVVFRSGDDPERLRGMNLSGCWLDEASIMSREVYEIMIPSLRQGGEMGWLSATFTPKGKRHWTYDVFATQRPNSALFSAASTDNPWLPPKFVDFIASSLTTHQQEQELKGKFVDDIEGALWRQTWIDAARVPKAPETFRRIVVAIDPAVTASDSSDETGIAVAAKGEDGDYYVLHCRGYKMSPNGWANRALALYDEHKADRIIAEKNNGGDMVESTLRQVRVNAPIKTVVASKGKALRAEPIAALYERGRVHHVGSHPALEDQLCAFPVATEHDDLVDAAVYALTELAEAMPLPFSWYAEGTDHV